MHTHAGCSRAPRQRRCGPRCRPAQTWWCSSAATRSTGAQRAARTAQAGGDGCARWMERRVCWAACVRACVCLAFSARCCITTALLHHCATALLLHCRAHYELFTRALLAPNVREGAVCLVHPTCGPTQARALQCVHAARMCEALSQVASSTLGAARPSCLRRPC